MFYKLLKSLVQIEMINDKTGKIIKRIGSKTNLKDISIRVTNKCLIIGVKVVKKVVAKVKKWLDSFKEIQKFDNNVYSEGSSDFKMGFNKGNYYNILRA